MEVSTEEVQSVGRRRESRIISNLYNPTPNVIYLNSMALINNMKMSG